MLKTVSASERTSKLSEAGGAEVSPGSVASGEAIIDAHGGEFISPGAHGGVFVSPAKVGIASRSKNAAGAPSLLRFFMVSPLLRRIGIYLFLLEMNKEKRFGERRLPQAQSLSSI
jgi:hypothetical protein